MPTDLPAELVSRFREKARHVCCEHGFHESARHAAQAWDSFFCSTCDAIAAVAARAFLDGQREALSAVIDSPELLEIGRKAVEEVLVDMRDNRVSMMQRGNGLVIRERDGKGSDLIRLGAEDAIRIGLTAIRRTAAERREGESK